MEANNKAMREALKTVKRYLDGYTVNVLEMRSQVDAALAAPLRNYEVGTADEQWTRIRAFCKRYKTGLRCVDCPVNGVFPKRCALIWAQMPYEERGAK